jgi:hypothetical protein
MSRSSAKWDSIFGCFIALMSSEASPGTEKTWLFQEPFRRFAECEGLESTTDTTGTYDVHRYCEALNIFSDLFRISKNQDVNRLRSRPRPSAKWDSIFGCFIASKSSEASPGTEKTWLFQKFFRRLAECEGIASTSNTTGTYDVHRCCEALKSFSDDFRTLKSQGINDVGWVREMRQHFRMLYLFNVTKDIARYWKDLIIPRAFSETHGMWRTSKYRWYHRCLKCLSVLRSPNLFSDRFGISMN